MNRYELHFVKSSDIRTQEFLLKQEKKPSSPAYGGMLEDVINVKPTVYAMATAIAVYFHPQSKFYQSEQLLKALELAADFVARFQRENGSFDYPI